MIGVDQGGISDTLQFVLSKFTPEQHQRLINVRETVNLNLCACMAVRMSLIFRVNKLMPMLNILGTVACLQNVFITGGCASFANFKERIEKDLQEMCPFKSRFSVNVAKQPVLDAWCGARKWATQADFDSYAVTKEEYEEMGGEWLKEHFVTNRSYATPKLAASASEDFSDKLIESDSNCAS